MTDTTELENDIARMEADLVAAKMEVAANEMAHDTPTPDEARTMFTERPDCSGVLTTGGWMARDGTLTA